MRNQNICLIGCGWLGKPLAKKLTDLGYGLTVTTASDQSAQFQNDELSYISFDLKLDPSPNEKLKEKLDNCDVLIYTIPPLDLSIIKKFFDSLATDKKIIFTSSTSVYGKRMGDVDESLALDNQNTNSPLLLETENYLKSRFKNLTLLRLGGLYGQERHPVYFLSGRNDLRNGGEFLHLAHNEDCLNAILGVLNKETWGETFNISSDLRVTKEQYYVEMARKLSLPLPCYAHSDYATNETKISNLKSKKLLGISYLDPGKFCISFQKQNH